LGVICSPGTAALIDFDQRRAGRSFDLTAIDDRVCSSLGEADPGTIVQMT
jgi:hypothetical protein